MLTISVRSTCVSCVGVLCSVTPPQHRETLAATVLSKDITSWQGFLVEGAITFILVMTVFGATNSDRKCDLHMPTIPIGFAISLGIMSGVGPTVRACVHPCVCPCIRACLRASVRSRGPPARPVIVDRRN